MIKIQFQEHGHQKFQECFSDGDYNLKRQNNQGMEKQQLDSSVAVLKNNQPVPYQDEKPTQPVGFFSLFRFAKPADYVIMAAGTVAAICNGAAMPLFALLWGDMIDSFKNQNQMVNQTLNMLLLFIYIGIAVFVTGWIMIACWLITGQRQSIECRKQYLKSLLRQQIGWFDSINQAQLSSQFSADTMSFQGALSDKIPLVLYVIAMGISGFIVAFVKGWLLTLVLLGVFPLIILSMYLYMYNVQNKGKKEQKKYAEAGGRAEQALFSIKTVKVLNGESFESKLYDNCLVGAGKGTVKFGIFSGISIGGAFFAMLTAYSLGFWYGAHCINQTQRCLPSVARQQYTAGIVFTVFFSIIIVGFNMSQLPPSLKKITQGRTAAGRIFRIIDREPRVKNPVNGIKINDFKGIIRFHNVSFSYPKDRSRKILNGLNLQINKSKVAFVGQSGCGKSTILQLIMRFYDPDEGYITIDGHNLRDIDLVWLRQVIGYVGQQPVLFATTIKENLLFANEKATDQQLQDALRKAEALQFVNQLQKKMDTYVGLGGGQISGGQKQRIAIARAILRDPKILLLDQATSALDRKNQKLIQKTLNQIAQARTSITIAHRVKTIMNSDEIFVIQKGRVKQSGKFQELKRFDGIKFEQDQVENEHMGIAAVDEQNKGNLPLEKKLTKEQREKKEKEQLMEVYNKSTYRRVFSYAKGSQILFVLGIIASGILGAVYPVFSIFLSSMLQIMLRKKDFIDEASTKALIFFLLGVLGLLMSIVQNTIFCVIGQKITRQIRSQTFYKMLKLPIYWYQRPKNNIGSLTARLAVDCKQVKQMTTTYIYGLFQNLFCLITGLVIAFIFEWRTSLVALGLIPFLIAAGAIRMAFRTGSATKSQQTYKESSGIIMESMTNIRTVCSFGYQNIIYNKYAKMLQIPQALAVKNGLISGFFYGLAQFIMFIVIALIFYLGSLFIQNNGVQVQNMFTAIFAIFFSAMTVGNNSHILPDMGECKISAANLFLIMDTKDQDQIQVDEGSKMLKKKIQGDFQFQNIKFKYETRNQYLFNNFNLHIPYGDKVAFVGTSGCGKSTIMSFLLRFYMPESGQILLDGVDIKDYDIHYLRSQFGVVSQQPVLFNTSFKQNIKYNSEATDEEIIHAAKQAHAYDFIMNNEQEVKLTNDFMNQSIKQKEKENDKKEPAATGFDRSVGIKGSHISGGQKQRVAIARAILRKPQILLLDEATSALDSINEKKVQDCLDQIMIGKTSISIAHRLDTIKNSKIIYVFDKGRVAEQGRYEDLMEKKGYFYNLEKGIQFA